MIASLTKRINADLFFFVGSFLIFTLVAFFYGIKSSIYYSFKGVPVYWFHLSYHYLASGWTWVLMLPFLVALTKSFYSRQIFMPIVVILALPIGAFHRFISLFLDNTFRWLMGYTSESPINTLGDFGELFFVGVFDSLIAYFVILILITLYYKGPNPLSWVDEIESIKSIVNSLTLEVANNPKIEKLKINRERLIVKKNGRSLFLKVQDINWFKSEGNYMKVFYDEEWVMIRETMSSMQQKMDANQFYRINRSTIININFIKEFEPWFNGEYTLTLLDGSKVNTSKTYRSVVNRLLQT